MSASARAFERQLERVAAQATRTQSELFKAKAASLGLGENVKIQGLIAQLRQAERIKEVGASATALVRTLGGLGLVVSGGGLVALATASVRAVDALNGLSASSGASIENVSALDDLARRTGVSFGSLEAIILQTNKALADARPDNAAGRALKALGLDAAELRRQDPAEALRRIAVALNGYGDGANKARIQAALLGRQTKEGADFLRDLGQQTRLTGSITADQAAKAEAYTKALAGMKAQAEDTARALTIQLAPAITSVLEAFNKGGFKAGINAIGELTPFNQAFFDRLRIRGLESRAESLRGIVADPSVFDRATGRLEDYRAELAQVEQQLESARRAYLRLSDGAAGGGRGFVNPDVVRPELPDITDHDDEKAKAAERAAQAYRGLISSITERISAEQAELAGGEKLSAAQRVALDTVGKLATAEARLSDAQKAGVTVALESYLAIARQVEIRKEATESAERYAAATERAREGIVRQRVDIDQANAALLEQIATLGMTADQAERWRIAQAEAALAARETAIAIERASGVVDENADAVDGETEAMRRQLSLRKQLADAATAQATRAAGDSLAAGLASDFGRALESAEGLRDVLPGIAQTLRSFAVRELVTAPLEDFLRTGIRGVVDSRGTGAGASAATDAARTASLTAAQSAQTSAVVEATGAQLVASSSLQLMSTEAFKAAAALAALSATEGTDAAGNILSALFPGPGGSGVDFGANPFAAVALDTGTNRVPYDGMRAILHKDEAVVPAKYNPAVGGGRGGPSVVIHEAPPVAKQTQNADGSMEIWFERAVSASVAETERRMATGGTTDRVMRSTYGVRRNLPRRD